MRMLELQNKDLVCEVCGENIHNRKTVGVESDDDEHVADSTLSSLWTHRHRLNATLPRDHCRLYESLMP